MDPRLDLVGEREGLLDAEVPAVAVCGWSEVAVPVEALGGCFLGVAFLGVPPPLTRAMAMTSLQGDQERAGDLPPQSGEQAMNRPK